jgi:hypothetical protein
MDWLNGFFIPLIEITFIVGIVAYAGFYFIKGIRNAWTKSAKFTWKYRIMRRSYPESTLKWVLNCMDQGIGYYDAKKILMVKMIEQNKINETLWIYDQVINEIGSDKQKSRKLEGKNAEQNLPTM